MGFFPCFKGHRFKGAALHAYPAIANGGFSKRAHLRACPEHFEELIVDMSVALTELVQEGADGEVAQLFEESQCGNCGQAATWSAFLNAYPRGETERYFYGRLCEECALAMNQKYSLAA